MSSRRAGVKFASAGDFDPSTKGNNVAEMSIPGVNQLNQGLVGVKLDGGQVGDGWVVFSKKGKSKVGNNSGNQCPQQNSTAKAWGSPDTAQKLGMSGGAAYKNNVETVNPMSKDIMNEKEIDVGEDEEYGVDELLDDSDDDLLSDGYDSDASQKSLETSKKNRWFKELSPGGADKEIVWPPMVIIRNTQHDKDEDEKWIGMGTQELLDYFSYYSAAKARHSYGPQGHRGISVLIFEGTALDYIKAARLNSDFENSGAGRSAWERGGVAAFYPGGKRILFGYLAEKKDLDFFNQHCQGKPMLKFEMKSYHEMVVKQFRKIGEDNQQLLRFKNKLAVAQKHSKALEETHGIVTEKLRKTLEENHIVRQRGKIHHEKNKEEMDYQEGFFKEQLAVIYEARKKKEGHFEKIQQNERQKAKQTHEDPYLPGENEKRLNSEDVQNIINMESFVDARETLMKAREERILELKRKHFEEEVVLEKELDRKLAELKKQYSTTNAPPVNGNVDS